jgi:hypothetical protein
LAISVRKERPCQNFALLDFTAFKEVVRLVKLVMDPCHVRLERFLLNLGWKQRWNAPIALPDTTAMNRVLLHHLESAALVIGAWSDLAHQHRLQATPTQPG